MFILSVVCADGGKRGQRGACERGGEQESEATACASRSPGRACADATVPGRDRRADSSRDRCGRDGCEIIRRRRHRAAGGRRARRADRGDAAERRARDADREPMLDPVVHAALAAILPPSALLTAPEDTRPYECDGLTLYRELPAAVVLPETEAQVVAHPAGAATRRAFRSWRAARARACPAARCPTADGVVLSLAKFRASSRSIRWRAPRSSQPGVRNLAISEAARAVRALLRARSVVADRLLDRRQRRRERGRRALPQVRAHRAQRAARARRARSPARSSNSAAMRSTAPGYDLLALITGSEGLLAVITEITVKLTAEAAARASRAGRVRRRRRRRATRWRAIIGAGHHPGGPRDDGPAGHARGRGIRARRLSARRGGGAAGRGGRHARGSRRRDGGDPRGADAKRARRRSACRRTKRSACSSGRDARRRFRRSGASRPTTTASTARSRAARCRACCARIEALVGANTGCRCANVFHAGDGNLHPLILFDANKPGEIGAHRCVRRPHPRAVHRGRRHDHRRARRRRREAAADVRAVRAGRARALPRHQGGVRRATACSIPGKGVPTLRAAPSSARMHVHAGELPHPELPRF